MHFLFWLTLFFNSFSVEGSTYSSHSLSLSMSEIAMNTKFNLNSNIASCVNSAFKGFSIDHQINYWVKELSVSKLQYKLNLNDHSCLITGIDHSGNKAFNESGFDLGYAQKLGAKLNGGIKLKYNYLKYSDESYSDLSNVIASIYFFANASNKINVGCLIENPTRVELTPQQNLPATIAGGFSYLISEKATLACIAIQSSGKKMDYSIGITYQFLKEIEIRASYQNQIESISSGISLVLNKMQIELNYRAQPFLGNRSGITILIPVK